MCLTAVGLAAWQAGPPATGEKASAADRASARSGPNFIVIMVDDQALNTFKRRVMPKTFRWFERRGTRLPSAYAVPPLCCPARAGFQTGQLPHNHGVYSNHPGFPMMDEPGSQVASWLDAAGYRTGFAGKFMNGYRSSEPLAGYDDWWGVVGRPDYRDYTVSIDGKVRSFSGRSSYITEAVGARTEEFVRRAKRRDQPFFFWASHVAPHARSSEGECDGHANPLRRDLARVKRLGLELPKGPAFNERDISDKTSATRSERMTPAQVAEVKQAYRCAAGAMRAVDRTVDSTFKLLKRTGLDHSTVVAFVSDNGYFYGEHRRVQGKTLPFRPSLEVPMAISVPKQVLGHSAPDVLREPVATIDLTPTFLELAGADACTGAGECTVMDGRSIAGVLRGRDPDWPRNRELLVEIKNGCTRGYRALRSEHRLYVEYYKGAKGGDCTVEARELYDTDRDPHELENLLSGRSSRAIRNERRKFASRMKSLARCNGIKGRDTEGRFGFCG